jgi:hypothetical protein
MPTNIPVNNMAQNRANVKRPSTSNKNKTPSKAPRTSVSPGAITKPPRSNLKEPLPTATTTATDEVAAMSVAASRTTSTTASASTRMPPRTVHVPGLDGGGNHETGNDELTKATAATTLAYGNRDSDSASNMQMAFTIRNYVTQYFFPSVKFITKKEKLALYPPGTNPTSYCAIITRGCNLPHGIDLAKWWETVAKRVVKREINQLRSDKITALKKAYFGNWGASVQFQFCC